MVARAAQGDAGGHAWAATAASPMIPRSTTGTRRACPTPAQHGTCRLRTLAAVGSSDGAAAFRVAAIRTCNVDSARGGGGSGSPEAGLPSGLRPARRPAAPEAWRPIVVGVRVDQGVHHIPALRVQGRAGAGGALHVFRRDAQGQLHQDGCKTLFITVRRHALRPPHGMPAAVPRAARQAWPSCAAAQARLSTLVFC